MQMCYISYLNLLDIKIIPLKEKGTWKGKRKHSSRMRTDRASRLHSWEGGGL